MNLKQVRTTIVVLALMIFAGGVGFWFGQQKIQASFKNFKPQVKIERNTPPGKENVDFNLFWQVWDTLEASYLDKKALDPTQMVYGAISGMVSALGDPYTVFLPPQAQKQTQEELSGTFQGVGMQLGYKNSQLAVIAPLKGTPADKAGVKAGDLILKIRDEKQGVNKTTDGMSLPEAVSLIRGPRGTSVFLTFMREGKSEPWEVELRREDIVVKSVELDFKDKIADLRLLRFGERTPQEWDDAVKQITDKVSKGEVKGVVFDLRNDPGGFLQGAIYIASEFLPDGTIVKQENAGSKGTESFSVNRKGRLINIPLVVLINQGSASASEIVAGVLQERGRAKVVGEKSFGKGTIQEAQDLPDGSGLHITIARWLLPSGKSIDKEGIKPDFEVIRQLTEDEKDSTKDLQLEKAMELLK